MSDRAHGCVLNSTCRRIAGDARLLVGICGIPASGKSTLAALLVRRVAELLSPAAECVLVGLDGWHLTRADLDAMDNPQLAHDRRGIHWTFDAHGYVSFVKQLRTPISRLSPDAPDITAPSFDHALKDPSPHAIRITPQHRIVIIEGLYTFLSIEPWCEGGSLLDERWYIELDPSEAAKRLVKRHVATGVAKDLTEAQWRSDANDMPSTCYVFTVGAAQDSNCTLDGQFVIEHMLKPTRIIPSQDDPTFAFA